MTTPTFRKLRNVNLVVGVIHLAQAGLMLALSNDLSLPITATFLTDDPVVNQPGAAPAGLMDIPIGPAVALFLLLAAVDHLAVAAPRIRNWYETKLSEGINLARWIEYSVSASIMVVLIGLFVGLRDIGAVLGLFGINASMILFGLLMEKHQKPGKADWSAFWFGSLAGVVPWIAIWWYVIGAPGVPGFVYGITVTQLILFTGFALNQALQYAQVGKWRSYLYGEYVYIILSLTAKSLLAWLIFANVLRT